MFEEKINKIIIFKWSALGDVILAVPSLRAIRKKFPQAEIYLLIKRKYKSVLSSLSYIDKFIDFEKAGWRSLIPTLKKEKFDLSIDFQNTYRSHLLAFLGKAKNRLGYQRKGGGILLNLVAKEPRQTKNPIEHQLHLLLKIGINLDNFELECKIPSTVSFEFNKPYISILPGAGEGWQSKCWSELSYARLADILIEKFKWTVIFVGEEREKGKIERIKGAMKERAKDLAGQTTLTQLAGVIKESSLFVTHDSGPMHLSQALGVPTLALFGPTDPKRHTVPSANLHIIKKNLPCQPCYRRRCLEHKCMCDIQVEEVINKITQII